MHSNVHGQHLSLLRLLEARLLKGTTDTQNLRGYLRGSPKKASDASTQIYLKDTQRLGRRLTTPRPRLDGMRTGFPRLRSDTTLDGPLMRGSHGRTLQHHVTDLHLSLPPSKSSNCGRSVRSWDT